MMLSNKWMSLVLFVVQNSVLIIGLRACAILSSHKTLYIASTVVIFSELLKLLLSALMIYINDAKCSLASFKDAMVRGFVDDGADCLKLCVPAILYCIQNNLQYVIESAPLFLVVYQSKIITTAVFYTTLLSRRLSTREWFTIVALAIGVSMVESSQHDIQPHHASNVVGIVCVMTACLTSGFAGVYFEKILKQSRSSIWMINFQLSLLSSFFCVSLSLIQDTESIIEHGLVRGYNGYVVLIIVLQAVTGLVVALVVKYADNIHKGFAASASIIISNSIDAYVFADTDINYYYTMGSVIVVTSCWLYATLLSKDSSVTSSGAAGVSMLTIGGSSIIGSGGGSISSNVDSPPLPPLPLPSTSVLLGSDNSDLLARHTTGTSSNSSNSNNSHGGGGGLDLESLAQLHASDIESHDSTSNKKNAAFTRTFPWIRWSGPTTPRDNNQ